MTTSEASSLKDILANKKSAPKAPAHSWQDLALRVIRELGIPGFKKSAVFKVCRDFSKEAILRAMNDTKELVAGGEQWKYFFKILDNEAADARSRTALHTTTGGE